MEYNPLVNIFPTLSAVIVYTLRDDHQGLRYFYQDTYVLLQAWDKPSGRKEVDFSSDVTDLGPITSNEVGDLITINILEVLRRARARGNKCLYYTVQTTSRAVFAKDVSVATGLKGQDWEPYDPKKHLPVPGSKGIISVQTVAEIYNPALNKSTIERYADGRLAKVDGGDSENVFVRQTDVTVDESSRKAKTSVRWILPNGTKGKKINISYDGVLPVDMSKVKREDVN